MENDERALINSLRKEASDVKECFTKFSFQAIALSGPFIALVALSGENYFVIAISTFAIVSLLLSVVRLGTYKYATANRYFGYELHLEQTKYLINSENGWTHGMRKIGWEEALRAWRVVQPLRLITFTGHGSKTERSSTPNCQTD